VRLPKLGWIKFRDTRPMLGRNLSVTVSCRAGTWFASFSNEIEREVPVNDLPAVGIDRGVANTLALSNGEMLSTTDTSRLERRKRRAQRILARRVRGSQRYLKQRRRAARLTAKIAHVREDWRHKATTSIADRFGQIAIEALKVANMTASGRGKRGLNRSILEQSWGVLNASGLQN
jgi:putative transposase